MESANSNITSTSADACTSRRCAAVVNTGERWTVRHRAVRMRAGRPTRSRRRFARQERGRRHCSREEIHAERYHEYVRWLPIAALVSVAFCACTHAPIAHMSDLAVGCYRQVDQEIDPGEWSDNSINLTDHPATGEGWYPRNAKLIWLPDGAEFHSGYWTREGDVIRMTLTDNGRDGYKSDLKQTATGLDGTVAGLEGSIEGFGNAESGDHLHGDARVTVMTHLTLVRQACRPSK